MNNFINKNKLIIKIGAISVISMPIIVLLLQPFKVKTYIGYQPNPIRETIVTVLLFLLVLAILALTVSVIILLIKLIIQLIQW